MSQISEKPAEEQSPNKTPATPTPESTTPATDNKEPQPHFKKGWVREYFESAVVTVIMALFGMTFIVQAVKVPTGSMLNTILVGDHLLVNKFIFGKDGLFLDKILPHRPIRRGDVIVFKFPGDPSTNYVKRVVGLPGETIEVKGMRVFINGKELPEQHVLAKQMDDQNAPLVIQNTLNAPEGATYKAFYSSESDDSDFDPVEKRLMGQKFAVGAPFTIPPDQYFAMGDNRDNSQDSRYWGTVPRDNIVGRALVVYWSLDLTADEEGNNGSSNLAKDILTRTRWSRMGTLIK